MNIYVIYLKFLSIMVSRNYTPFPDMRDPTTGEWLPASYSSEKAAQQAAKDEAVTKAQARNMSAMLISLFK